MKFSHAVGVGSAVATFALASVALACPPKPPTAPPPSACPPQPCGSCGCNISTNAAFGTFSQTQGVSGNFGPVRGEQNAWATAQVNVGKPIEAKTVVDLNQVAKADAVSMMNQNQAGTFGASATGPTNLFPGLWTAKTQGIATQSEQTWGTNIKHEQDASTWQHSTVDGVTSSLDAMLHQKKDATGTGDITDTQQFNTGTQAQWWAVPPFPKSHTFDIPAGVTARLFQNITNVLQFGPF